MLKKYTRRPLFKILLVVLVLLASLLAVSGCVSTRGAIARGWAGGAVSGDVLFTGTMEGNLVSVNLTDGQLTSSAPLETSAPTTGFLSCAQASTAVAIYGSPVIANNLVYVGGYNGKVYAFSSTGNRTEPRWVYPRQDNVGGSIIGGLAYDQGKLYFGTTNNLVFALDAKDGYQDWKVELGDMVWSTPAIDSGTLYVGCFDKNLYALNAADGSIRWKYETGGAIVSSPVISNGMVYFGSFDRNLYALDSATGALKWKFAANNWFWATPVVFQGTVYAPCLDGKVYAINAENGQKIAEYNLGSPISSSPVLVDNALVVTAQNGETYRIDKSGEKPLDSLDVKVFAPLIAGTGKVYVHTNQDTLYEIDVQTGAEREILIK